MTDTFLAGAPQPRVEVFRSRFIGNGLIAAGVLFILTAGIAYLRLALQGEPLIADFDAFRQAGLMVLEGRPLEAYRAQAFIEAFEREFGETANYYWMYPPHYFFVATPLAMVPRPVAFIGFLAVSAALFTVVLRRLSPEGWVFTGLVFLPVCVLTMMIGQNGLLTAGLVGLFLLAARARDDRMGAPLALMSLKPQLALAPCLIFLHVLTARRLAVFLATGLGLAALTTLVFGAQVWAAFLGAEGRLDQNADASVYRFDKFTSYFGMFAGWNVPLGAALAVHAALSAAVLAALWRYSRGGAPELHVWGVGILALAPVTPYAYDYDLPVAAVGFALIAADLLDRTGLRDRLALLGLVWMTAATGVVRPGRHLPGEAFDQITLNALLLTALAAYCAVILRRPKLETPSTG